MYKNDYVQVVINVFLLPIAACEILRISEDKSSCLIRYVSITGNQNYPEYGLLVGFKFSAYTHSYMVLKTAESWQKI